ncbi:TPA: hypothetical protein U0J99_001323 [Streptococcus suis]|nr:hypothetical protein [Streptococcus suis]
MNKNEVNKMLPQAVALLKAEFPKGRIPNEYRGYISTFGAAVLMGSLAAAVAFNSDGKASTKGSRPALMKMILDLLKETYGDTDPELKKSTRLFDYVTDQFQNPEVKDKVLNAAIAIKLGMNLFEIEKEEQNGEAVS